MQLDRGPWGLELRTTALNRYRPVWRAHTETIRTISEWYNKNWCSGRWVKDGVQEPNIFSRVGEPTKTDVFRVSGGTGPQLDGSKGKPFGWVDWQMFWICTGSLITNSFGKTGQSEENLDRTVDRTLAQCSWFWFYWRFLCVEWVVLFSCQDGGLNLLHSWCHTLILRLYPLKVGLDDWTKEILRVFLHSGSATLKPNTGWDKGYFPFYNWLNSLPEPPQVISWQLWPSRYPGVLNIKPDKMIQKSTYNPRSKVDTQEHVDLWTTFCSNLVIVKDSLGSTGV